MGHCDDSLRKIGRAIFAYQKSHNQNPASLEILLENEALTAWDLICPVGPESIGECSYVYRGDDLYPYAPDEMILAYDKHPFHKGRRNLLFANGQVHRPPEPAFLKALDYDNQFRRELGLTEKPFR